MCNGIILVPHQRFFMKLFNTNNIEIVKCCQQEFCFSLPSITLAHRTENFLGKIDSVIIFLSKESCVCKILYFVTLPAIDVFLFSHKSVGVSHCIMRLDCFVSYVVS